MLALASTDLAATTRARQGTGQPQTTQAPQKPADEVTVRPTTTLVGCLYREDQVPERKPNIAERAGILEDYILADAKTSSAQTQAAFSRAGITDQDAAVNTGTGTRGA